MPIDFAAIATQFREPLTVQTQAMAFVLDDLGDRLDDLVKDARRQARAMRAYPLLRFSDDALGVSIGGAQAGTLLRPGAPTAPLGERALDTVRESARRFVAGIGWIDTAVKQELVIPRTLEIGAQGLDAILASLERFAAPTPAMFDPRARTISDLFGEAGLAFRAIATSREQVGTFAGGVGMLRLAQTLVSPPAPGGATAPTAPLAPRLAAVGQQLLQLVVLLPLASATLLAVIDRAVFTVKEAVLLRLAAIEGRADHLRAEVFAHVRDAFGMGMEAVRWLQAASAIITINISFLAAFYARWAGDLLAGMQAYLTAISQWTRHYTDWLITIQSIEEQVMGINLLPFILAALSIPAAVLSLLPGAPELTLGDLIDMATSDLALRVDQVEVALWLGSLSTALWLAGFDELSDKVDDVAEILITTLEPRAIPAETALPPALGRFPDIADTLFGGGRAEAFGRTLMDFGQSVRGLVGTTLNATASTLTGISTTAAASARWFATMGSVPVMAGVARRAHDDAARAFAGPMAAVQAEMDRQGPDALADAFESAVAGGGFQVIGAAIPAYVAEVRRYWTRRAPDPTSPHILARHGRLDRVRVPRMTIRAPGRAATAALADDVALRFRVAVGDAYVSGLAAAAAGTAR